MFLHIFYYDIGYCFCENWKGLHLSTLLGRMLRNSAKNSQLPKYNSMNKIYLQHCQGTFGFYLDSFLFQVYSYHMAFYWLIQALSNGKRGEKSAWVLSHSMINCTEKYWIIVVTRAQEYYEISCSILWSTKLFKITIASRCHP